MLIVNASPEELKVAGRIATAIDLESIRLVSLRIDETNSEAFLETEQKRDLEAGIHYSAEKKELVSGKYLSAIVGTITTISDKATHTVIVKISIQYLVKYRLPGGPIPPEMQESDFAIFARYNGLLNCWPYIRSQVNHLSAEMALPIILPLLKITAGRASSKKKSLASDTPGSVDRS